MCILRLIYGRWLLFRSNLRFLRSTCAKLKRCLVRKVLKVHRAPRVLLARRAFKVPKVHRAKLVLKESLVRAVNRVLKEKKEKKEKKAIVANKARKAFRAKRASVVSRDHRVSRAKKAKKVTKAQWVPKVLKAQREKTSRPNILL